MNYDKNFDDTIDILIIQINSTRREVNTSENNERLKLVLALV